MTAGKTWSADASEAESNDFNESWATLAVIFEVAAVTEGWALMCWKYYLKYEEIEQTYDETAKQWIEQCMWHELWQSKILTW